MSFFGGFPFGGMGGMGFPGQEEDGEVDNEEYYKVMELSKQATQDEIKKKFKQLAKKHHPDVGGKAQKFAQIREAYETLSDPQRREQYDRYGKGAQGGGGQQDLINMLLRGRGGGGHGRKKEMPKMKPTKKAFNLTLEMSYLGGVFPEENERTRLCDACGGKGGKDVKKCGACKGQGAVMKMTQMGPGMYTQTRANCPTCNGEGQICKEETKCKSCNGRKVKEQIKKMAIVVEKGTPHNHPLIFPSDGNEVPDAMPGDLIYITQEQPHAVFTRKGADLSMKVSISLAEALLGFTRSFKHLDGNEYSMSTVKGEVIGDHEKRTLKGLGMPFFKDPMHSGNLIVEFKIEMPRRNELNAEQLAILASVLPGKVNPRPLDQNYGMLEDFEKEYVNSSEEGGKKKDQEEEEQEQEGGFAPSCQAQ